MPAFKRRVSLIVFVVATLLVVGLVPLVLTGWLLSDKSGRELRASENRYQIQLVDEKARQIEMFGHRWTSVVESISTALELSKDSGMLSSAQTEAKLGTILKDNPELLALYIKPANAEAVSVFRAEALSRNDVESVAADTVNREGKPRFTVNGPTNAG